MEDEEWICIQNKGRFKKEWEDGRWKMESEYIYKIRGDKMQS